MARTEASFSPEDRRILRAMPMFTGVSEYAFDQIAASAHTVLIPARTVLFQEGEPAADIYVVASGWVKLYRMSQGGSEAIISLFSRGRSFGEAVGLMGRPYPANAEAVSDCRLIRINSAFIISLLRQNPDLATGMIASMNAHLHQLVGEVTRLKALNGTARVVEFLTDMAGEHPAQEFTLPFEKQLLASLLGMQPESLSRTLKRLRDFGIEVDGRKVLLATPDALSRAAESAAN